MQEKLLFLITIRLRGYWSFNYVKNHDVFWFSHDVFANGGLLELWMSPKPNKK